MTTYYRGGILAEPAPGGKIPRTVEKVLAASAAFLEGALLLVNGSGQFAECGADPTSVAAVALTPAGTDSSGFNILGHKEFPPGYVQGIAIQENVKFSFPYMGTLPASDGGVYGMTRDSDSYWKVDFAKVDPTVQLVTLVGRQTASPESQPYVYATFLPGVVQSI